MHRLDAKEIPQLAEFLAKQFWSTEEILIMLKGLDSSRAKQIAPLVIGLDIAFYGRYGDMWIYDQDCSGAVIGIDSRKRGFHYFWYYFCNRRKYLGKLNPCERRILAKNEKDYSQVRDDLWFKKYGKSTYYVAWLAVETEHRGQGVLRKLLQHIFDYTQNSFSQIALETHTASNVPIYEHFGFSLLETKSYSDQTITEYRMLKTLT